MAIVSKIINAVRSDDAEVSKESQDVTENQDDIEANTQPVKENLSADRSEDRNEKDSLDGSTIIQATLPFLYFNLLTIEGRQDYVNILTESQLANMLTWIPFILIMALASTNVKLAIWLAFSITALIALIQLYHHSYKPEYPMLYWLNSGSFLGYLGLGIANEIRPFSYTLISPITISVLAITVITSLVVCSPFTMQFARVGIPESVAKSPYFLKINNFLTGVWVGLFAIMAGSSWASWGAALESGSAGEIILSIVIPIVIPIAGIRLMPTLANWYRSKNPPPQTC